MLSKINMVTDPSAQNLKEAGNGLFLQIKSGGILNICGRF